MAEKMTTNGLVIGLIVDPKGAKRGKPVKPKGEESKLTNESSEQNDSSEQAEQTEE